MQPQYQMGYDRAITVFSPDGRLYQVEYAREAVKRGTTAVGIKAKDGVVLIVDKRVSSKLLEASSIEKIFKIDEHIGVASSGLVGDARALVDRARVECQINRVSYDEPIEVEALSKKLCDHMQSLTQYGGIRPYGTALLIAGVSDGEFRLFETDPSGTLLEYKATGIGIGRPAAMKVFEEEYNPEYRDQRCNPARSQGTPFRNRRQVRCRPGRDRRDRKGNPVFRKMSREEVATFVEQFKQ